MQLDSHLEALLFYKAESVKKSALLKLFNIKEEELEIAIKTLQARLEGGATRLVITNDELELALAPDFDEFIEGQRREEMKRDIGKAGAETLAIVLYRGPVTRAEIDRIRGVNSSHILRNLEIRGLITRTQSGRQNEYRITTELLKHLGISEKTELPDYGNVMNALEKYENSQLSDDNR